MKTEVKEILTNWVKEGHITLQTYMLFLSVKTKEEVDKLVKMLDILLENGIISVQDAMTVVDYINEAYKTNTLPLHLPSTEPLEKTIPYSFPTYPNNPGSTDPYPWQLPQVWCNKSTTATSNINSAPGNPDYAPFLTTHTYQINS